MKFIDDIKKAITYLPGIRRPQDHSLYNTFLGNYGWAQRRSDKPQGDFEVYYEALNNVYVHRCIHVEIDSLLATGFQINKLSEDDKKLYNEWEAYKKSRDFENAAKIRAILIERGIL